MISKSSSSENNRLFGGGRHPGKNGVRFQSLVRENLHGRMATLLLGMLVMFCNYPLNMSMQLSQIMRNYGPQSRRAAEAAAGSLSVIGGADGPTSVFVAAKTVPHYTERLTETANAILAGNASLILLIVLAAAAICAWDMFRYLTDKRQVDFYHSQPVSRTKRFAANYISGILIMALCYAAGLLSAVIVAAGYHVEGLLFRTMLIGNLGYFLCFLLIYSVTVFSLQLAGTRVMGVLMLLLVSLFGPITGGVFAALGDMHIDTYYMFNAVLEKWMYLSPYTYLMEYGEFYRDILMPESVQTAQDLIFMEEYLKPYALRMTVSVCAGTLLFTGLSYFAYLRRPSESAGVPVAFPWTKRPIRVFVTVLFALYLSLLGASMETTAWIIFFTVLGAVIAHAVTEILFYADVKALFRHKAELLCCTLLGLFIVCAYHYDIFGVNSRLPERTEIESAALEGNLYDLEKNAIRFAEYENRGVLSEEEFRRTLETSGIRPVRVHYPDAIDLMRITEPGALDAVYALSAEGIGRKQNEINPNDRIRLRVNFFLKDGTHQERSFYVEKAAFDTYMPEIFAAREYKEAMLPVLSLPSGTDGLIGFCPTALEAEAHRGEPLYKTDPALGSYGNDSRKAVNLFRQEKELNHALNEALKQDLSELRYEEYDAFREESLHSGTGEAAYPLLLYVPESEVAEKTEETESEVPEMKTAADAAGDPEIRLYDWVDVYPVLDCFTHVREVLSEYGYELR